MTPADASNSLCLSPGDATMPPARARTATSGRSSRLSWVGLAYLIPAGASIRRVVVVGCHGDVRPTISTFVYLRRDAYIPRLDGRIEQITFELRQDANAAECVWRGPVSQRG